MKKILCSFIFVVAAFLVLQGCSKSSSTSPSSSPAWRVVGNAGGFSNGAAGYTSLYVSNNTPYVAYVDATANSRATVMTYNGSSWVNFENLGSPSSYTSLYVYNGTPYVAYQDYLNEVAIYDPSVHTFTTANAINTMSFYVYNGAPYVAYVDAASNSNIAVTTYTGVSWTAVGNAFGQAANTPLSLYVNNGTPYVAYVDAANSISVTTYIAGNWTALGNTFGQSGNTLSLYVNNGIPYVAYSDGSVYGRATVMQYSYGFNSWVPFGGADFSEESVNYISLQFYNLQPYVAFQDNANSGKATVMTCGATGGNWSTVGNAGFSAGAAQYISLFVNPNNGIPCVAYCDGANFNKATMMYYH